MTTLRRISWTCLILALPAVAAAQATSTAPTVELAGPYMDRRVGFSIKYPAGADRQRVTSATNLVSWSSRDAATGAIGWTLTVQRATEGDKAVNVKAYASTVVDKLATGGFKSESLQVGQLAGKDMFEIAGKSSFAGKAVFWQRQAWVQGEPGHFLIVLVSGPVDAKDKLDALFQAVAPTLQLYDRAVLQKAQAESLQRGKEFLAALTVERLRKAAGSPQYFLMKMGGKTVGYLVQKVEFINNPSPELKAGMKSFLDVQGKHEISREMTYAADRSREAWHNVTVSGKNKDVEDVIVKDGQIACTITPSDGKAVTHQAKAPEGYLSPALRLVLPRLLPLDKNVGYSFLSYVPGSPQFHELTVTVEGKQARTAGGKSVEYVRLIDLQEGGEGSVLADADGNVLEIRSSANFVIEACTSDELLKAYPAAKDVK